MPIGHGTKRRWFIVRTRTCWGTRAGIATPAFRWGLQSAWLTRPANGFARATSCEAVYRGPTRALGSSQMMLSRLEEARTAFQKAQKLDPASAEIVADLATAMHEWSSQRG